MKLTRRLVAVAALAVAFAPAGAQPKKAVDWTRTVVATAEGGFRMGNPAAKVKLIEYGSLTCPHCRHFVETAMAPIKARVRTGKVSFEFRNYVLNGPDVSASLVARCAGASRFFPLIDRIYATQPAWVAKISGATDAQKAALQALPEGARMAQMAELGGVTALAAAQGYPAAQAKACASNPTSLDKLLAMREAASARGVNGTPTFFVNDELVQSEWPAIDAALKRAGG